MLLVENLDDIVCVEKRHQPRSLACLFRHGFDHPSRPCSSHNDDDADVCLVWSGYDLGVDDGGGYSFDGGGGGGVR